MQVNQVSYPIKPQISNVRKNQSAPLEIGQSSHQKSLVNPNYYQALNGIAFKGAEQNYSIDIDKTVHQMLMVKIFSILNEEEKADMELIDDVITLTDCPDEPMELEEGKKEVQGALCSALSDHDDSHFVKNVLNSIEDDGKRIEMAMLMKKAFSESEDTTHEYNIEQSKLFAEQIMQLSKTENSYDLSNFKGKLALVRRIANAQDNAGGNDSNTDYFNTVLECSRDENGKIDFLHMNTLSYLLLTYDFQNPPIEKFSDLIKKSRAKSKEQEKLIMTSLVKLSSEYSLADDGFETNFNHCFEDGKFSTKRFEILLDVIDSTNNLDRCGKYADKIICGRNDIDYNEFFDGLIDSFFNEVVDCTDKNSITSKSIDTYVMSKFQEALK